MREQVKVTPVKGVKVRQENGQLLPEKGKTVEKNSYWIRRHNDGDVHFTAIKEDK